MHHLFWNVLIIRKGIKSFLKDSLFLTILIPLIFIYIKPAFTYNEGIDVVVAHYQNEVEVIPLHHTNVPVSGTNYFVNRFYYYQIDSKDSSGENEFYMVNPTSGQKIKLDSPYWETK